VAFDYFFIGRDRVFRSRIAGRKIQIGKSLKNGGFLNSNPIAKDPRQVEILSETGNPIEFGGNMKTRICIYLFIATFCTATFLMTALLFAGTVSGLAATGTAQIPCYLTIVAGGELHVPIDADRKADLEITTRGAGQSVFTVLEYRNGKPRKGFQPESTTLDRDNYRKAWRFNRFFDQTPESSVVDEVRIKVETGEVTAKMGQTGDNRQDFYNYGYQHGTFVYPKKPLTVKITGDDPSNGQTSGRFWLKYETGNDSEKTPFTIQGGKTLTWNYPADQGITNLEVDISKGRAKISLIQVPDSEKPIRKPSGTQKASQPSPRPKANASPAPGPKKQIAALPEATQTASASGSILSGEVPLFNGARVLKSKTYGTNASASLEVAAPLQDIADFYKQAMSAKGWTPIMTMVQGDRGAIMFKKKNRQLAFKLRGKGGTSKIDIAMMDQ
jgi:hypothetical protein